MAECGHAGLAALGLVVGVAAVTASAQGHPPVGPCEALSPMVAVRECYAERLAAADRDVEAVYTSARSAAADLDRVTGHGDALPALEESQALWRAFRRVNCDDLRAALAAGGSGTGVFQARCAIAMTEARIAELEEIARVGSGGEGADRTADAGPLVGSAWRAEDIEGRGVIDFAQTSLEFEAPDKAAGGGACNRFFGGVTIDGDRLTFGALASTRRACPPAIMDQEQNFFRALEKVRRWEIRNGLLFLYGDAETPILRFSRLEGGPTPQ